MISQVVDNKDCAICLEINDVLKLSCGHFICAKCTNTAFSLAAKDESLFPPTCCKRIPVSVVLIFLEKEIYSKYSLRAVEFSTKDRIYCPLKECSAFIQPEFITITSENKNATCPRCNSWVSECISPVSLSCLFLYFRRISKL